MQAALIIATLLAAAPTTATDALKARDQQLRALLPPKGQEVSESQKSKAQDELAKFIDFRGMAEAALGKQWVKMTEPKRKELLGAFTKRLRAASGGQLDFYRSTEIQYAPEEKVGEQVKVPTTVEVKGEPTQVGYVMKDGKSGWLIEDIVIDDVSTVATYKASFAKIIAKDGVDGLIAKLKKEKGAKAEPAPAPKK
jgi:phospholipid transport system substrate-binding protein